MLHWAISVKSFFFPVWMIPPGSVLNIRQGKIYEAHILDKMNEDLYSIEASDLLFSVSGEVLTITHRLKGGEKVKLDKDDIAELKKGTRLGADKKQMKIDREEYEDDSKIFDVPIITDSGYKTLRTLSLKSESGCPFVVMCEGSSPNLIVGKNHNGNIIHLANEDETRLDDAGIGWSSTLVDKEEEETYSVLTALGWAERLTRLGVHQLRLVRQIGAIFLVAFRSDGDSIWKHEDRLISLVVIGTVGSESVEAGSILGFYTLTEDQIQWVTDRQAIYDSDFIKEFTTKSSEKISEKAT